MTAGSRRVVLVAGKDPRTEVSGGHGSYVRAHAHMLQACGFEPHLVCIGRPSVEATPYGVVHAVASPVRPVRQNMAPWHTPFLGRAIDGIVGGGGVAAVHSFGVWGCGGRDGVRRLRRRGVKVAALLSSYTTYEAEARSKVAGAAVAGPWRRATFRLEHEYVRRLVQRYEGGAYRHADAVFYNYDSVAGLVRDAFGPSVRLRRAPYTTESAFAGDCARAAGSGEPAPVIVAVSRHDPRKGIDVLLRAFARLRAGGTPFRAVLVGGGPLLAAHRRLLRALGLGGCVSLAGVVPDVTPYLASADLFVLPSRNEQSGSLALIEAMQAGLPVVATACDGIPEDLVDGEHGLLAAPGDPASLAAALSRVLGNETLRRRLAAGARRRYDERFAPAAVAAGLLEAYRDAGVDL